MKQSRDGKPVCDVCNEFATRACVWGSLMMLVCDKHLELVSILVQLPLHKHEMLNVIKP